MQVESSHVGIDRTERRRRRALRGFWVSMAAFVLVCLGMSMGASALCLVSYIPFIATLICLVGVISPSGRPVLVPGRVTVEGGVLRVEPSRAAPAKQPAYLLTEQRIPLADVVQGYWEAPSLVHLVTRSGEAVVVSLARDEGERLLHAAGVAASERVLRVPLASLASRVPALAGLTGLAAGGLGFSMLFALMVMGGALRAPGGMHALGRESIRGGLALAGLLATSYGLLALLRRREAVVGTDGVRYRRFLRTRFIPYPSVARVGPYAAGVEIERRDGAVVRLRTLAAGAMDAEARRAVLLDRIQQAMTADAGALARVDLERLDRHGRPFTVWRAELGKLLSGTSDYRTTVLSAADLASVIEDPAAPAARRIAAVVALGAAQPEEARRRVRIVAPAFADDELRRALERAAEGEIDEDVVEREEKALRR